MLEAEVFPANYIHSGLCHGININTAEMVIWTDIPCLIQNENVFFLKLLVFL